MGDVIIFKTAQHMGNRVAFADIGQELIAKAFTLAGTFYQTRDIHKGHPRRNDLFGTGNRRQLVQPRIRHGHVADIGFYRAKREVCSLCGRSFRQRVEQGRFAHVWQTHNTHFETHGGSPLMLAALLWGVEAGRKRGKHHSPTSPQSAWLRT